MVLFGTGEKFSQSTQGVRVPFSYFTNSVLSSSSYSYNFYVEGEGEGEGGTV